MANPLHDKVFNFLEDYRSFHPDFLYWLRERNTGNRLMDGYWFQGNLDYAYVGLYDRSGGSNKTRSIGIYFSQSGQNIKTVFEVVFNEEEDKRLLKLYTEIMKRLGGFNRLSDTRFQKTLSTTDGFRAANDFLNKERPIVDKAIQEMNLEEIFIEKDDFDSKLKHILSIRGKLTNSLFPTSKIEELKSRYAAFKKDDFFKERVRQLRFIPFAQKIISNFLKNVLTNEALTGLIQVLKNGAKSDTVNSHIDKNITALNLRSELKREFSQFGFTGYTSAGKTGINGLDVGQLEAVKKFILDCAIIKSTEEGIKRVEEFDALKTPQVKCGVYSPWLYYINPSVFPIKNNSHDGFIQWCNQPTGSYPTAILLFHEVAEILGEKDLGLIDAFTHKFSGENLEETETNLNHKETNIMTLNTILYGPPGTGKTYHTINKSVVIANPQFAIVSASREQLKAEYERLVRDGQIEFITFHQSMSYEDFIEGIKPVEPKEEDDFLKYEIKDGIFKRLCEKASKVPEVKSTGFSISEYDFQKASFYKISLGDTSNPDDDQIYEWCIHNGYIALGWGDAIDFTGKAEIDIQQMAPSEIKPFAATAINSFIHYLKAGNFVIVSYGNHQFRAIGKVTGNYEYKNIDGLNVHQFRKVEWLVKDIELPYEEVYDRQFSQQSIYRMDKKGIKKDFFVKAENAVPDDNKVKNYVLIIDEINRGNVSQIFGELITLIEEDKRAGKGESLITTLPYSKKSFSVPPNLYIIGTMNTADRSVEALDTALRRRFSFEPMLPDTTKITESPAGIDLPQMLNVINARLEALLSKDHTIGHAWLMNVYNLGDLRIAFKNRILPLLQEFFYNDYAKIGLVLGNIFVQQQKVGKKFFAAFKDNNELAADYEDKIIYTLINPDEIDLNGFKSIYE